MAAAIELAGVSKAFGPVEALHAIDLDVAAGEMVTGEVIPKFSHAAPVRTRMSL